jgi:adenylate cyclase
MYPMAGVILLFATDCKLHKTIESYLHEYTVIRCDSESQAIDLCRKYQVFLLLFEDAVQDTHPQKLLTMFRDIRPTITGILLCSNIDNDVLNKSIDTGFDYVVEIPLDKKRLRRTIEKLGKRASIVKENIRLKTLLPLYRLGEKFLSSTCEKEICDSLLDSVSEISGSQHISILLYDDEKSALHIATSKGINKKVADSVQLKSGDCIAGWVYKHGKPVILNKENQHKSIFAPFLKRPEIISAISCPIIIRGKIIGVLNISQTETDHRFTESDKEVMGVICGQAALAIENVRSLKKNEQTIRTRTLLEQYVSPQVAELLIEQQDNPVNIGEIQDITILFADIRNFTTLVQELDLDHLRTFLNQFFNNFSEIIFEHQGTIDKFMGDAVLAFFGAPVPSQYSTCAAVEAAAAMREGFRDLCGQWSREDHIFKKLDLGIGVTKGKVFLGNVGSAKRFDYTVIGNEVNIAQRLAAESTQCRIYLTEIVKNNVSPKFNIESLGNMNLRGIKEEIPVFFLAD